MKSNRPETVKTKTLQQRYRNVALFFYCFCYFSPNEPVLVTNFGNYYIGYYGLSKPALKEGDFIQ